VGYLELSLNKSLIHRFVNLGVGTTTVESSDFDASGGRFDGNGCSASGVKPDLQKIHPLHDVSELTARLKYYPTTVYKFLLLLPQLRKLRWRRSVLG
jgi:hypothetical protein